MRTPYGNSGHPGQNRSLNNSQAYGQQPSLPLRSSAQVFAQQSAQDSSLKRYASSATSDARISAPSPRFENQDSRYGRQPRRISPTGARPFNPHPEAGAPDWSMHSAPHVANTVSHAAQDSSQYFTNHKPYDSLNAPYSYRASAPSAAVAVPRPARIPAGYMPYTQTTNMGKGEDGVSPIHTPRRTQPPINIIDDYFPEDTGGRATEPNMFPPDLNQDIAGVGTSKDSHKDRFRKNLKYGEYLSIPQGSKSIFSDKDTHHAKPLLWMALALVVLIVVLVVVWSFA